MRKIVFLLATILVVSCNSEKQADENVQKSSTEPAKEDAKTKSGTGETYPLLIDTLKINLEKFIVVQNHPRDKKQMNLSIVNRNNDTVYIHDGSATNGFKFEDFDNNGVLDIRLYQITNVGGVSELIFFDTKNKIFKAIEYFDSFEEPIKIKNTKYWFSYHSSGCSDINWGSELFKIENFKAIRLGEIEGIGCENEKENGIFIYTVKGTSKKRIYSEKREPGYYDDKWDFIGKYWNKNYPEFE